MPLTPEYVHNVAFSNAPAGYDKNEVDAFMDQVEAELARLNERVEQLEERDG